MYMLQYIYTGEIPVIQKRSKWFAELLFASDKYNILGLRGEIQWFSDPDLDLFNVWGPNQRYSISVSR